MLHISIFIYYIVEKDISHGYRSIDATIAAAYHDTRKPALPYAFLEFHYISETVSRRDDGRFHERCGVMDTQYPLEGHWGAAYYHDLRPRERERNVHCDFRACNAFILRLFNHMRVI